MGAAHRETNMIAGYHNGITPPKSGGPYYQTNQTVELIIRSPQSQLKRRDVTCFVRMINSTCANPKAHWKNEMNSTTWPSALELATLQVVSKYCEEEVAVQWSANGEATIQVTLEAYAAAQVIVPLV